MSSDEALLDDRETPPVAQPDRAADLYNPQKAYFNEKGDSLASHGRSGESTPTNRWEYNHMPGF